MTLPTFVCEANYSIIVILVAQLPCYLSYCKTNLVIVLHELSFLFWHFINIIWTDTSPHLHNDNDATMIWGSRKKGKNKRKSTFVVFLPGQVRENNAKTTTFSFLCLNPSSILSDLISYMFTRNVHYGGFNNSTTFKIRHLTMEG